MTGFNIDNLSAEFALAHDREQEQIRENSDVGKFYAETQNAIYQASQYATSADSAKKITEILRNMIEKNSAYSCLYKYQVFWDAEDIFEALNQVCIALGIDEEQFTPQVHDKGHEVEIYI